MTNTGTRALCGEHGLPIFCAAGDTFCEQGCKLSWSDLSAEAGDKIVIREGNEIFAAEVWVESDDEEASADEVEAAGLDSTGRDGDPRFPYKRSDLRNP